MNIRILRDCDYDITPAVTLAFKAGTEENRPKDMAEKLISLGLAEAIPSVTKPQKEN